jgi:hypothetical protein
MALSAIIKDCGRTARIVLLRRSDGGYIFWPKSYMQSSVSGEFGTKK